MKFTLKEGLLLGTATAATQIEGGDENNSWARFAAEGKVNDKTSPTRACDHYNRWREDIDLMAEMGMQIYRLGIEWSRIEPTQGNYDYEALDHYRKEIEYMKEKGIKPLLTLHHFTNPLWFEDMGGWTSPESVEIFADFVEEVMEHLGDIVDEYITINEPNVYCLNGYFYGIWPPEQKSIVAYCKALSNMAAAHIKAYQLIHNARADMGKSREETLVSFANHLRVFVPKKYSNPWYRFCARFMEHMFQTAITDAMMSGKCTFPILRRPEIEPGRYFDFIGINYYSRSTVSGINDGTPDGCDKNDLGWEIYHDGLIDLANYLSMQYGEEYPIFVTENGTCDNNDSFRPRFIYDQLKLISELDNRIERYYHWSFVDNFEWREGESARFGIVHVDYETQKRSVKNSGKLYSDIIKNQGVTDEAYAAYVEPTQYHK
ncbi:MAG: glycoside hydrolase family 1 protein [Clostridia bacterium]|nr:glycoside hydrolase family 1 protein [Clostridia bacterium]